MYGKVNESDWKLFRQRLPGWQEAYMQKLIDEYTAMLTGPGAASDKFWDLEKRIQHDKRDTGVIAEMRRSQMNLNIMNLLAEDAITLDDLDGFSEELQEQMAFLLRKHDEINPLST